MRERAGRKAPLAVVLDLVEQQALRLDSDGQTAKAWAGKRGVKAKGSRCPVEMEKGRGRGTVPSCPFFCKRRGCGGGGRVPQPRSCDSLEAQAAGVSASRGPLQNAARRARRCHSSASSQNPRGRAAAAAAQTAVRTRASLVLACLRRRPLQPAASSGSSEHPPLHRACRRRCCRQHQTFFFPGTNLGLDVSSIFSVAADLLRKRVRTSSSW